MLAMNSASTCTSSLERLLGGTCSTRRQQAASRLCRAVATSGCKHAGAGRQAGMVRRRGERQSPCALLWLLQRGGMPPSRLAPITMRAISCGVLGRAAPHAQERTARQCVQCWGTLGAGTALCAPAHLCLGREPQVVQRAPVQGGEVRAVLARRDGAGARLARVD